MRGTTFNTLTTVCLSEQRSRPITEQQPLEEQGELKGQTTSKNTPPPILGHWLVIHKETQIEQLLI